MQVNRTSHEVGMQGWPAVALGLLIIPIALCSPASAGLFQQSVELEDLAQLSQDGLEGLKEDEFDAILAKIQLAGAQAAESEAAGALRAARRDLEVEELDFKAAKAEEKAAKANRNESRLQAADQLLAAAKLDHERARAFESWKKAEFEAASKWEDAAEARVDLAEAKRDFTRVRLLAREGAPAAKNYELGEFSRRMLKRQAEYDERAERARRDSREVEGRHQQWTNLRPTEQE